MPSISDDIFFASITEINQKLTKKEFSAVELARAFCDRLETIGPRYNALALSLRKDALCATPRTWMAISSASVCVALLQGIPFGAKDLLAYAKHPTTWGAKPYEGQVFDYTASVLKHLQKRGGLLTGKLAMVELAGGPSYRYASASLTGPGLNPWDNTRWSGGSSSGSAIAVAAGLVTYALGSETSGSILTPSAFCGVTGLRPTYGLVSRQWRDGALLDARQDRTALPLGRRLRPGAGSHRRRRLRRSRPPPTRASTTRRSSRAISRTFASASRPSISTKAVDPAARADYAKALETIRSLGVEVAEAESCPSFPMAPSSAPSSPPKAPPSSSRSSRAARWISSPISTRSPVSKPAWRFQPRTI